jgi:hypothetical protein
VILFENIEISGEGLQGQEMLRFLEGFPLCAATGSVTAIRPRALQRIASFP